MCLHCKLVSQVPLILHLLIWQSGFLNKEKLFDVSSALEKARASFGTRLEFNAVNVCVYQGNHLFPVKLLCLGLYEMSVKPDGEGERFCGWELRASL